MPESGGVFITNKEIYDLLQEVRDLIGAHTLEDERRFSKLNAKVYGVMTTLIVYLGIALAKMYGFEG